MPLVEVEITGQAITAQYGTLETGTILRTSAEFAAHLVNEAHAAKYTKAQPATAEETKVSEMPKKRLTKAEKAAAGTEPAEAAATVGDVAETATEGAAADASGAGEEAAT